MTRKQVLKLLKRDDVRVNKMIAHKDGSFSLKRSFYYNHSTTAAMIGEKLMKSCDWLQVIDTLDDWCEWPKTSYFVVRFVVKSDN